jgi:origin recognition complex subunit 1
MADDGGAVGAALALMEAGIIVFEAHRCERRSKMRLAVGDDEVRMALRDESDLKVFGLAL